MQIKCQKKELIPFEIIADAVNGNSAAINYVLQYYTAYIAKLSTRVFYDEYGNSYSCIDEEIKGQLQTKLISKILTFEVV